MANKKEIEFNEMLMSSTARAGCVEAGLLDERDIKLYRSALALKFISAGYEPCTMRESEANEAKDSVRRSYEETGEQDLFEKRWNVAEIKMGEAVESFILLAQGNMWSPSPRI